MLKTGMDPEYADEIQHFLISLSMAAYEDSSEELQMWHVSTPVTDHSSAQLSPLIDS